MIYSTRLFFKQVPEYSYKDYLVGSFLSRNSVAYKSNEEKIKTDILNGRSINVRMNNTKGVSLQKVIPPGCYATSFDQPKEPHSLISYLSDLDSRIPDDAVICHYTRADVVEKIIKSRKWLLGRPTRMNDRYELGKFKGFEWDSLFFASFICNSSENIAMWVMYTNELENGVMVSLKGSVFKKWIKSLNKAYEVMLIDNELEINNSPISYKYKFDNFRVGYYDEKKKKFSCEGATNFNFKNPYAIGELMGYVKDDAWSYENEFRLAFKSEIVPLDVFSIAIDVPDFVIKALTITKGPFCEKHVIGANREEVRDCSKFYGKIDKMKLPLKNK